MRLGLLLLSLSVAGCYRASSIDWDFEATTTGASETAGTGTDDVTGSSSGSPGQSSSDGDDGPGPHEEPPPLPEPPPAIDAFALMPAELDVNGVIAVEVDAPSADGVRMKVASGGEVELAPDPDVEGRFLGGIPAFTGLHNGEHEAALTPWRGVVVGPSVVAGYTFDLPTPGSEAFWETGDTIGMGFVAALAVLPGGDVIELGTRYDGDDPRCYLRRRDMSGAWWDAEVVQLLGGQTCTAMDLQVADDGTAYLLLLRHDNGVARWWLGSMAEWGAPTKNLRLGSPGEEAVALAIGGERVAVCGSVPTDKLDGKDAAAWVYKSELPGESWAFDYQATNEVHHFGETTRGCAFAGDELVMVGEARGLFDGELLTLRSRHFIHRIDLVTQIEAWQVAAGGIGPQSGATAVAIDDQGRVVTVGYRCGDDCDPEGMIQVHDDEGLLWHADIGALPSKAYAARAIAWSPAGYAVVVSGGTVGDESSFTVRAFAPLETVEPVWAYTREDQGMLHMGLAIALGPFGEIWAGGFGANGYPAIARVNG